MKESEQQFFCIRGHMKSGTNWVCRLMNLHPDIHSSGEYHWNKYFAAYQQNRKILVNIDKIEAESATIRKHLEAMVRNCMTELAEPTAKLIGDRTPTTIHPVVLRDASYICMIRDVRDIVVSKFFHTLNAPRVLKNFSFGDELTALKPKFDADPWYFQKHPEQLLSCEGFVRETCRRWRKAIKQDHNTAEVHKGLKVKFIHYEALHKNFRPVLNQIYRFLNVDPAAVTQVPKWLQPGFTKEQPNGFNRKGAVGDWQNYMTADAHRWITEEAGEDLLRMEYIDSLDWAFDDVRDKKQSETKAA